MRTLWIGVIAVIASVLPFDDAHAERQRVVVPNVLELRVRRASAKLAHLGLEVRLIGKSSGVGRRIVTGQNPAGGRSVVRGAKVRLTFKWVADGAAPPNTKRSPKKVVVPDVIGLRPAAAQSRLQRAGLASRIVSARSKGRGIPFVTAQNPSAGKTVKRGAQVRLTTKRQPR